MFLSRLGKLAAASFITLVTVSSVSAQSVEQVVRSEFGHNFGLFGPLAFDAEDVFVRSNTVSLKDASYGSVPVGLVSIDIRALGDSIFDVKSIEMPTRVTNPDGSGVQAAQWDFAGEWNDAIKGYQRLEYRITDLALAAPNGLRLGAGEVVMRADESGYSLRLSNLTGSGGAKPAEEGDPDTSYAFAIENIIYDGRWTGSAAGAPYASLGRSFDFRFLDARNEGNDSLLGATLVHLDREGQQV